MPTSGLLLYRYLEQQLPGVLRKRYRQLRFEGSGGNAVHPIIPDLKLGARELTRLRIDEVGEAKVLSEAAFDIPIVDISAEEDKYKTLLVAAAWHYDYLEEQAFMVARSNGFMQGIANVATEKERVARKAIAERHNKIGAYGVQQLSVPGFLNNANVEVEDSSFDPLNEAGGATADDIHEFVVEQIRTMYTDSNNIDMPADFLVSDDFWFKLVGRRVPDGSKSLLAYIKETLSDDGIPFKISKAKECNSAMLEANGVHDSGTNKDRLVLYVNDSEVVERHFQMPRLVPQEFVEVRNLKRIFPLISCTSQTIINYSSAVKYIDIPKKAAA